MVVVITSPLLTGFVFITTIAQEYATMPNISAAMQSNQHILMRRANRFFSGDLTPLIGKKKLEVVANALIRDAAKTGYSKKMELAQVFYEHIADDKKKAIEMADEGHRYAIIRDKFNGHRHGHETYFLESAGVLGAPINNAYYVLRN